MTESSIEIGAMSNRGKLLALVAGPILGLLTYFLLPESYINSQGVETAFPYAGRACMGVTVWMAIWWFTEALPIAATAMIPLVVYPLLQITSAKAAMSNYASGTIFLFLGGFLLAAGIHRWHLDRRIALLTLRLFGTQPDAGHCRPLRLGVQYGDCRHDGSHCHRRARRRALHPEERSHRQG